MVLEFEKGKGYVFSIEDYELISAYYNEREVTRKMKRLDGTTVIVLTKDKGGVKGDCMTIRPQFCKEV